jgi:anti-sigma B factor antagonist
MQMEITTTQYKRCDVIHLSGRLDSATAPKFADAINALINDGRFRIVVEMSALDFISSAGLRVLITAQKNCKRYNRGEVVLTQVPTNIMSALDLSGFTTLFSFFPALVEAVGNF